MSMYEGIVEDDNVAYGYVKVRIFGKHNRDKTILPTKDLPNAKIVYSAESNIDEISYFRTICNGTWIVCTFLDDHEQHPIVLGSVVKTVEEIPDFSNGFTDENGEHPSQTGTTIPSEAITNYPHNRVLKTKKHLIEIDDTDGVERINIRHDSNSFITFEADGSITINSTTINVKGDLNVEGDIAVSKEGLLLGNITATGEITADLLNEAIELSTHVHGPDNKDTPLKDSMSGLCTGLTASPEQQ